MWARFCVSWRISSSPDRAAAPQPVEQPDLDRAFDLLERDHLAAARADRVAALVPAAVDIVPAQAAGFVHHRDGIAAFLAFHQPGKPAVRARAAVAQRAVAVELALHCEPERGVHDALVRGERDEAAGQVGEFAPRGPFCGRGGAARRIAVAAAALVVGRDRVVHHSAAAFQIAVDQRVRPHERGIAQQPPERERGPAAAARGAAAVRVEPPHKRAQRLILLRIALEKPGHERGLRGVGDIAGRALAADDGLALVKAERRTAAQIHAGFRTGKVVVGHAALDGLALELREHHHDLRHDRTRGRIVQRDALGDRLEMHAARRQPGAQPGEVVHRTADAVQPVNHDLVNPPVFRVREQLLEGGAVDVLAGKALVRVYLAALRLAGGQRFAAELRLLLDRDAVRALD